MGGAVQPDIEEHATPGNQRWVINAEGHNWDLLLPYVLFVVHEAPQASTGFGLRQISRYVAYWGWLGIIIRLCQLCLSSCPLSDLTRKGEPEKFLWMVQAEEALNQLKTALSSSPVLQNPVFERTFLVQTDTSWAVLSQDFDREEHPVIYISQKLTPTKQWYAMIKRGALAIKWAMEDLRYYLTGRHFTSVTDQAPLQWLNKHKDTNSKITCWFLCYKVVPSIGTTHLSWSSGGGVTDMTAPLTCLSLASTPRQSMPAGNHNSVGWEISLFKKKPQGEGWNKCW